MPADRSMDVPLARWIGVGGGQPLAAALGKWGAALGCFGCGTIALGLGIPTFFLSEVFDPVQLYFLPRVVATILMVSAVVGWAGYGVFGLWGTGWLIQVRPRACEPKGLRDQRKLLLMYVFLLPVIWLLAALIGATVLHISENLAFLVVPVNGFIFGLPMLLARQWVAGIEASLTRDRTKRRRLLRDAAMIWVWVACWCIAAAIVVGAAIWASYGGNEQQPVVAAVVLVIGGTAYGLIVLTAMRAARRVRRRLMSLSSGASQPSAAG